MGAACESLFVFNESGALIFQGGLSAGAADRQSPDPDGPLALLLALAALEVPSLHSFEGLCVRRRLCVTGHRILLVGRRGRADREPLLGEIESALYGELLSPYTDDTVALGGHFALAVQALAERHRSSLG